jgi:hypothetical protein
MGSAACARAAASRQPQISHRTLRHFIGKHLILEIRTPTIAWSIYFPGSAGGLLPPVLCQYSNTPPGGQVPDLPAPACARVFPRPATKSTSGKDRRRYQPLPTCLTSIFGQDLTEFLRKQRD